MKTTTSKSSIQNLEEVLKRFLANKNTFSLTEEENENLKDILFELLSKIYDNYQLACIDINQIWVYETCYYTFTFESLVTVDRPRENIIAAYDLCKILPMVSVSLSHSPSWTRTIGFTNLISEYHERRRIKISGLTITQGTDTRISLGLSRPRGC